MAVTKSQAIAKLLELKTHPDLAKLYNLGMECQVNVAQDGGEKIEGDYLGRKWIGWTDSLTTWKSFRIPYKANTEPEYEDKEMRFDLALHAEAIGMTGWDWQNKLSRWVAFDFDSICGHKQSGLSREELQKIQDVVAEVPWVTIRKSTSGKGLHIYVFLVPVHTNNHTEHAALARAILGNLSALTGYNLHAKVDICGGNMWVWHRKMENTDGLTLIKQGCVLEDIPENWRDHLNVITGKSRKNRPAFIEAVKDTNEDIDDLFEELCGQRQTIPLDDDHKKLITYLTENNCAWWWDSDHHMLVTHTIHLKEAHSDLGLKGIFSTISEGKERGIDHNCFCYPLRRGAWVVRRYTPGVKEHISWDQDGAGWTRCFYNQSPDVGTAAKCFDGIEHPSGGYVFRFAEQASQACLQLGVPIQLPNWMMGRETKIKQHKDGRLIVEINKEDTDRADEMHGWLPEKRLWKRIFNQKITQPVEVEVQNYDDMIRHIVTEQGEDCGWVIKSNDWKHEPLAHVKSVLKSMGLNNVEIEGVIGGSVMRCWTLVNRPFQPEYPGNREWNHNAAQLKFTPKQETDNLKYTHWKKILSHIGASLDDALKDNIWAKINGITTGEEYLRCWIASLIQCPEEPLPYLFLYGPQNSGKSILHEALNLLFTKGCVRADTSLTSQSGFNGELENAVLCIVEETDVTQNKTAYNRIKDWVTSRQLPIHKKQRTPYTIPNTTHWIQCSNNHRACPIFPGDTRIVMLQVNGIDPLDIIPKRKLILELEKEAQDFITDIINLELPQSNDRLNVPVVETAEKISVQSSFRSMLEVFVDEHCHLVDGEMIKFSDFYERFTESLGSEAADWSKIRVGKELPPHIVQGRSTFDGAQKYLGNISWENVPQTKAKVVLGTNGFLKSGA